MCYEGSIWAAGFFDGEGSINIIKGTNGKGTSYYALSVEVAQVDPRPLQYLKENWGGTVRVVDSKNPNWNVAYRWTIRSKAAESFLRDIRPWLRVKGEQADIALEFRSIKSKHIKAKIGRGSSVDHDANFARQTLKKSLEDSR